MKRAAYRRVEDGGPALALIAQFILHVGQRKKESFQ